MHFENKFDVLNNILRSTKDCKNFFQLMRETEEEQPTEKEWEVLTPISEFIEELVVDTKKAMINELKK